MKTVPFFTEQIYLSHSTQVPEGIVFRNTQYHDLKELWTITLKNQSESFRNTIEDRENDAEEGAQGLKSKSKEFPKKHYLPLLILYIDILSIQ